MNICIYCGSSNHINPDYIKEIEAFGTALAQNGHTLIFGGGATGLMGAAARGVAASGGKLIGIAPKFFDTEGVLYKDCTSFLFTDSMSERKCKMHELADAFVMLPGGIGTFDEFFETYTLTQLGVLHKPLYILNINDFFQSFEALIAHTVDEGFLSQENHELYHIHDTVKSLMEDIASTK